MNDTRISFSSIHDICRPVSKEDLNPLADENTIHTRVEVPQFPPASRLISETGDEFFGCRTLYNTQNGGGPVLVRQTGRGNSFLAHFKDVFMAHDVMCLIADGNKVVFPNSFNEFTPYNALNHYLCRSRMTHSILRTGSRGEREWEHYLRPPAPEEREMTIAGPLVLMSNMVSMSYFHFLLDVVPKLWVFDEWPELRQYPILISPMGDKFEQALADLIGVPRSQFFVLSPAVVGRFTFKHLLFPSGFCDRTITRERIEFTRRKVGAVPSTGPRRRIYLSRVDRPYKTVQNELEVQKLLVSYGFEIHIGALLSVADQAKLFSETEMLVAVGGGGFTNMMFMQPGAVVMELTQRHPSMTDGGSIIFLELANLCKLNHMIFTSQLDYYHLPRGNIDLCPDHTTAMHYDIDRLRLAIEEGISLIGASA